MSEEGYVNIVGRCKDIIIRGGENISPSEVEHYLLTHPLIEEVHVFGIPHALYGEQVAAWVRLKNSNSAQQVSSLSIDDIKLFCQGNIAHYKVPTVLKIVDEFPMTVTGKVMKYRMRDMCVNEMKK